MASELHFHEAVKVAVLNPDAPTQVRNVSTNAWVELSTAPTFANCVTTPAQVGSTGQYYANLPTGLDTTRVYPLLVYASTATAFSDAASAAEYAPEVVRADMRLQNGEAFTALDIEVGSDDRVLVSADAHTAGVTVADTALLNGDNPTDLMESAAGAALTNYGPLKPTTAGRTLDVSATGEAGIDWSNIGSPTTAQTLSGTTVGTTTNLTNGSGGATVEEIVEALAGQEIHTYRMAQGDHLSLHQGDSYQGSEGSGRKYTITKQATETHWPTTLDTVHFYLKPTTQAVNAGRATAGQALADIVCTVTQATGDNQAFALELTSGNTDDLSNDAKPGDYVYQFVANKSDHPATLRESTFDVRKSLRV